MIHTRASAVRAFYATVEKEFDKGWKAYAQEQAARTMRSNKRLLEILRKIRGSEFVSQLTAYKKAVKCENAYMRIVRTPTGIPVAERRFPLIPAVWIEQRECEDGKYAYVSIQVKPERWVRFAVWF
ncbi:hypothetical protein [Larkinella sp. C7]|uniref:hypothetical protein n=1 Tax=Larkinella sp. C7 TaxID=2576607 RepID=UPI00111119BF|nr:hypothetical protein [Larkinella sp. C7]